MMCTSYHRMELIHTMPFPMTHLCVAQAMLMAAPLARPAQFMLGAVGPDSVHTRPGFTGEDKYRSHLCVGPLPWGQIEDNAAWRESAMRFWASHKDGPDAGFYRGYCTHVLTDIAWNEQFYGPLKKAHPEEFAGSWNSRFHRACSDVDVMLYRASDSAAIMALLREARPVAVANLVSEAEQAQERDGLLVKYDTEKLTGETVQSAISLERVQAFIQREAKRILSDL